MTALDVDVIQSERSFSSQWLHRLKELLHVHEYSAFVFKQFVIGEIGNQVICLDRSKEIDCCWHFLCIRFASLFVNNVLQNVLFGMPRNFCFFWVYGEDFSKVGDIIQLWYWVHKLEQILSVPQSHILVIVFSVFGYSSTIQYVLLEKALKTEQDGLC